jgi:hypothetical protein
MLQNVEERRSKFHGWAARSINRQRGVVRGRCTAALRFSVQPKFSHLAIIALSQRYDLADAGIKKRDADF